VVHHLLKPTSLLNDKTEGKTMREGNELFYFFLGIAVGVVATLLTSPYSGEDARHYLRERIDEGREGAGAVLEKGKEFVERRAGAVGSALGYGRKPNNDLT
jgi:gas vesicle protein